MTNAALVQRAQAGDAAAFATLAERHQDRVYNLTLRLCGNEADALDYTQTTLLKAWQSLAKFHGDAAFYTWLYRIAVNVTLSGRRRRMRVVSLDNPRNPDATPPEPAAPAERLSRPEAAELRAQLTAALDALDEEFRAPVVLRDVEELDYQTISDMLAVPLGTVKSRIFRGRMMLREHLQRQQVTLGAD